MERPERSSVQPLKNLPDTVTKKELRFMYSGLYYKFLYEFANEVMARVRGKTIDEVKHNRQLTKVEFKELIKIIDYPTGYEKFFKE